MKSPRRSRRSRVKKTLIHLLPSSPSSPPLDDDNSILTTFSNPSSSLQSQDCKKPLLLKPERFEEHEDCFIIDFDPKKIHPPLLDADHDNKNGDDHDLSIIAKTDQVAPHPRHLCVKFPFKTTPHENYCEMCYCYVCESAPPCGLWKITAAPHCNAVDDSRWKILRNWKKQEDITKAYLLKLIASAQTKK